MDSMRTSVVAFQVETEWRSGWLASVYLDAGSESVLVHRWNMMTTADERQPDWVHLAAQREFAERLGAAITRDNDLA